MPGKTLAQKRLILGFNADCMACNNLAKRIEEKADGKLELRSLNDPQITHWRKQALGDEAPWAPTLIEVDGEEIKAWTGLRMGVVMSRSLGPTITWRVMQELGEAGATARREQEPQSRLAASLSRGQFVKGVGGMAMAISVLSATGKLPSSASAAESGSSSFEEITGSELDEVVRGAAGRADVINIIGQAQSNKLQSSMVIKQCQNGECYTIAGSGSGSCNVNQVNGEITISGDCALVKAARHAKNDGGTLVATAYSLADNKVLVHYDSRTDQGGANSEARLYRIEGGNLKLESLSANGRTIEARDYQAQAVNPCPDPRYCLQETCCNINYYCVAAGCIGCGGACAGATTGVLGAFCVACLAAVCLPAVQETGPCCDDVCAKCLPC